MMMDEIEDKKLKEKTTKKNRNQKNKDQIRYKNKIKPNDEG
jgi:hypothetical protein